MKDLTDYGMRLGLWRILFNFNYFGIGCSKIIEFHIEEKRYGK